PSAGQKKEQCDVTVRVFSRSLKKQEELFPGEYLGSYASLLLALRLARRHNAPTFLEMRDIGWNNAVLDGSFKHGVERRLDDSHRIFGKCGRTVLLFLLSLASQKPPDGWAGEFADFKITQGR